MKEQIVEIIAEYLGKDISEIDASVTFTEIGLDSLDIAELVMDIEDKLDVSIELSQEINTIDKLVDYINANN
jgi:acyl carrier protein